MVGDVGWLAPTDGERQSDDEAGDGEPGRSLRRGAPALRTAHDGESARDEDDADDRFCDSGGSGAVWFRATADHAGKVQDRDHRQGESLKDHEGRYCAAPAVRGETGSRIHDGRHTSHGTHPRRSPHRLKGVAAVLPTKYRAAPVSPVSHSACAAVRRASHSGKQKGPSGELVPESWTRKCDVSTLAASDRLFTEGFVPLGTEPSLRRACSDGACPAVNSRCRQACD